MTLITVLSLSDDISEAYKTLRQLVMEYLGMDVNQPEGSVRGSSADRQSAASGSRPPTGQRAYKKMPSLNDSGKGSVVSEVILL